MGRLRCTFVAAGTKRRTATERCDPYTSLRPAPANTPHLAKSAICKYLEIIQIPGLRGKWISFRRFLGATVLMHTQCAMSPPRRPDQPVGQWIALSFCHFPNPVRMQLWPRTMIHMDDRNDSNSGPASRPISHLRNLRHHVIKYSAFAHTFPWSRRRA